MFPLYIYHYHVLYVIFYFIVRCIGALYYRGTLGYIVLHFYCAPLFPITLFIIGTINIVKPVTNLTILFLPQLYLLIYKTTK